MQTEFKLSFQRQLSIILLCQRQPALWDGTRLRSSCPPLPLLLQDKLPALTGRQISKPTDNAGLQTGRRLTSDDISLPQCHKLQVDQSGFNCGLEIGHESRPAGGADSPGKRNTIHKVMLGLDVLRGVADSKASPGGNSGSICHGPQLSIKLYNL
ncbi:Hypothetical predicted protein [Xyrichtys novacula]|uniref:Uncharacterized protein n=1 Tax=Xyrichtys novacula TaxID=13765 RepID=A0AAV1G2B1_XYRNO|nr:Hypothetical predicted protein [Xyrichtys novacula]